MRFSVLLLLLASCAALPACPGKNPIWDQGGPIWPDLILDMTWDAGAPTDLRRENSLREGGGDLLLDQRQGEGQVPMGWQLAQIAMVELNAVACVQGHVFAVGEAGTILHRAPGAGQVFTPQTSGTSVDLYTVSFADSTLGVTAGQASQIWQTTDLGQSWSIAPQCGTLTFEAYHALHLHSATAGSGVGVFTGGVEGGYKYFAGSWVCGAITYPYEIFRGVFRQGTRGWIVGDTGGKIYRTTDSGVTWSPIETWIYVMLRDVFITGSGVGVAVGEGGTILRSPDGQGLSWGSVPSGTTTRLRDVTFWDNQQGWIVGDQGTILHTGDGGQTWQAQNSPKAVDLNGVCFTSATEGWAVGVNGTLLYTMNGGS